MDKGFSRRAVFGAVGLLGLGLGLGLSGHAEAAEKTFDVKLTGDQQVPPVDTQGSGMAHLTYDPSTRELSWMVSYENLSSPVTMAHFHGPAAAGKNAGIKVWISKKGGEAKSPINGKAKLSAEDAKEMMAGDWYINVHTKDHPGGEIRGQVQPSMVAP